MKDNFSSVARGYSRFRPDYPSELINDIISLCTDFKNAWDCGTGNGQFAVRLLPHFQNIYATDISEQQLANARQKDQIHYSVCPAENTMFNENFFSLITVAQAVHWFDFTAFFNEVRRTSVNNGLIVLAGYDLFRASEKVNELIDHFYKDITGPYWDVHRRHLDNRYASIPFPFEEIRMPVYNYVLEWSLDHVIGYLETWSAVVHYKKATGINPVDLIRTELTGRWGEKQQVTIPFFTRAGRIIK